MRSIHSALCFAALAAVLASGCGQHSADEHDTCCDASDATGDLIEADAADVGRHDGELDSADVVDESDAPDASDAADGSDVEERCGDGPACAGDAECRDGRCLARCHADDVCEAPERCLAGVCDTVVCERTWQCRPHWRCVDGSCVDATDAACQVDLECGYGDACEAETCVSRTQLVRDVLFDRWTIAGATDRAGNVFGDGEAGYSIGGGLADIDGDRDLDLLLGGDFELGRYPCVLRNDSRPGEPRFVAHEFLCDATLPMTAALFGVDVENDGVDEVVVLGAAKVDLVRFAPTPSTTNLLELLPEDSISRQCFAGVMLAADLNYDGLVDLYVACQLPAESTSAEDLDEAMASLRNLVFLQRADHSFEPQLDASWDVIAATGVSLAVAGADINDDGLLDLLIADDTFSTVGMRRTTLPPGGIYRACAPGAECRFRYQRFADDVSAFGSFMGFGLIRTLLGEEIIYVSDWGPNRALVLDGSRLTDRAADLGIALSGHHGAYWFTWAVLVDDLDRNGLDDIYASQGHIGVLDPIDGYADSLLLQSRDGFDVRADVFAMEGSGALPFSRGGARADLDHDGLLEVVLASQTRQINVLSERSVNAADEPRCTLLPRPRVVPAYGVGYRVADPWTGTFRARDVQGQHRFGQSAHVLVSFGRGTLRFPSGAEVAFDCHGEPGPVYVEEPDWIALERQGDSVRVRLDAPWLRDDVEVLAAVERADGSTDELEATRDGAGWLLDVDGDAIRVMVSLDGRWVPRWWSVSD